MCERCSQGRPQSRRGQGIAPPSRNPRSRAAAPPESHSAEAGHPRPRRTERALARRAIEKTGRRWKRKALKWTIGTLAIGALVSQSHIIDKVGNFVERIGDQVEMVQGVADKIGDIAEKTDKFLANPFGAFVRNANADGTMPGEMQASVVPESLTTVQKMNLQCTQKVEGAVDIQAKRDNTITIGVLNVSQTIGTMLIDERFFGTAELCANINKTAVDVQVHQEKTTVNGQEVTTTKGVSAVLPQPTFSSATIEATNHKNCATIRSGFTKEQENKALEEYLKKLENNKNAPCDKGVRVQGSVTGHQTSLKDQASDAAQIALMLLARPSEQMINDAQKDIITDQTNRLKGEFKTDNVKLEIAPPANDIEDFKKRVMASKVELKKYAEQKFILKDGVMIFELKTREGDTIQVKYTAPDTAAPTEEIVKIYNDALYGTMCTREFIQDDKQ